MKAIKVRQRPKFPRPKLHKKKLWGIGIVATCILLFLFVLRPSGREELPEIVSNSTSETFFVEIRNNHITQGKKKDNVIPEAVTDLKPSLTNDSQEKAPFEMNLAGITAKEQQLSSTKAEQKEVATTPLKQEAPTQTTKSLSSVSKKTPSPVNKRVALPRSLDIANQPPLFAAESNLWNQPFVGFSLDEISAILSEKYKGISPKEWGEHLTGVTSRFTSTASSSDIVLTLDACGGKKGNGYDAGIISFLRAQHIPATLFVTSSWVLAHRKEFKDLSSDPLFEIAAHGEKHKPLSVNKKSVYGIQGTGSIAEVVTEVEANSRELHRLTRKRPKWFRSGTAYYDEIAVSIVKDLGLGIAGFSIAADKGATLPAKEVEKNILSAQGGDILICHMNHPESGTREGLFSALPQLIKQGYTFKTLSQAMSEQ